MNIFNKKNVCVQQNSLGFKVENFYLTMKVSRKRMIIFQETEKDFKINKTVCLSLINDYAELKIYRLY
jgi:hypothetical protein